MTSLYGAKKTIPRVCIAAGSSGSGKTTFTCGLLRALIRRNRIPAAFKCGPDYIDPMFHRKVAGSFSANLDLFFFDRKTIRRLLWEHTCGKDIAVLEGAMGFYDGLGGTTTQASAWDIARATDTPVILVEDSRALSVSLAARIKGLAAFRESSGIRGVALNRLNPNRYAGMRALIEGETGLKVLGFLPNNKDWSIESRHLGLITAGELEGLREKIDRIGTALEETVDLQAIEDIARSAPPLEFAEEETGLSELGTRRVGVARDKAFCFYYEDSLNLLKQFGAELVPFSPLEDEFPAGLDGLILGGGYPELYGKRLSENAGLRKDIRDAVLSGMPCIAECGGFMYLHQKLIDKEGREYPMAGVFSGSCRPMAHLVRFGYAVYTAQKDTLLCRAGDAIRGHEFHYWESDTPGADFTAVKPVSGETWQCINADENLFAGFPHVHFCAEPAIARRFLERCGAYHR
ncbi:MAG: cobyrinate a,c-diamide synthase [Spirochaetaceae bacterium]|jgi:cobyrinic acid a,c-diamide synthase|nr:cobyrinate a,c-diamide synthase [Spirochaetaceae bacterium]